MKHLLNLCTVSMRMVETCANRNAIYPTLATLWFKKVKSFRLESIQILASIVLHFLQTKYDWSLEWSTEINISCMKIGFFSCSKWTFPYQLWYQQLLKLFLDISIQIKWNDLNFVSFFFLQNFSSHLKKLFFFSNNWRKYVQKMFREI